ncbi:MAG: hypothetical protein [Circular genetic element sp.]|nr:MAG: hypothetical protein [Circular genetic element sp.]
MPIVQDRDGRGRVFQSGLGNASVFGQRLQYDYRFRAGITAALRAGTRPQISMGPPIDRRDVAVEPRRSVSQVRSEPTIFATPPFAGPIAGSNQAPNQGIVPIPQRVTSVLPRETQTGEHTMDLGSIIRGLGEQYITTRWGTPDRAIMGDGRTAPIAATPVSYPAGVGAGMVTPALAPLALAGGAARGIYGFLAGSSKAKIAAYLGGLGLALSADEIALMAADLSKVKCKRRRRRLATHSDIKDLAALSAVLGKGKLLETWVATRRI